MRTELPIDPYLREIRETLRKRRALLVVAPPGAGKTTRIPPALMEDGPVILLQPRRIAARALARRIAEENGWTLGEEVGWQVRFERRFGPRTRLLVATEGILTARLQSDPLLSGFCTVILDEFHERSLHADLALALCREAWRARSDLRLLVMSASLDAGPVAAYLDGCAILEAPGRLHPIEVRYSPELSLATAIRAALALPGGHTLCFLPGAPEIERSRDELARGATLPPGTLVLPLHGSLDPAEQDRALAPWPGRKVILATNLAETSLTVDGVTDVIDTGIHKVMRFDPATGVSRLLPERIGQDSATQRAGRAGRTGPGRCTRLWDPRLELRPRREPEIERVDLAAPFLEVLAWGANPRSFPWFEPPPQEQSAAALVLLERLGAMEEGRITPLGRQLQRLPLHPRLARVLLAAGASRQAAAACAIVQEGWRPSRDGSSSRSDLLSAADRIGHAPPAVRQAAQEIERLSRDLAREPGGARANSSQDAESAFLRAILLGYPDRVASRREPGSPRLLLASGGGAVLGRESAVREGEFLVALDLARGPGAGDPIVRSASAVDREWLEPTRRATAHWLDEETGAVRAAERIYYEALPLGERGLAPDPELAAPILVAHLLERGLEGTDETFLRRARFAGIEIDVPALVANACRGRTTLPRIDLMALLPHDSRRTLERDAPELLPLPSGRATRLLYRPDGSVVAAVKLQEIFGLAETPRIGPRREPVLFELLAPNGRPVQTTRDLRSFWERTYPEVRKELRGRYPKHPWPEDPWTATPTHRTR